MAPHGSLAGSYVQAPGTQRAVSPMLGLAGLTSRALSSSKADAAQCPLTAPAGGYLSLSVDALYLHTTKSGALKPKITDNVVASAWRNAVAGAVLQQRAVLSVLDIHFVDGSRWSFDLQRTFLDGARQLVGVLGHPAGLPGAPAPAAGANWGQQPTAAPGANWGQQPTAAPGASWPHQAANTTSDTTEGRGHGVL